MIDMMSCKVGRTVRPTAGHACQFLDTRSEPQHSNTSLAPGPTAQAHQHALEGFGLAGVQLLFVHVHLNLARVVFQGHEGQLAKHAPSSDTPCHTPPLSMQLHLALLREDCGA